MIFESFFPCLQLQEYVEAFHIRHFTFAVGAITPFKPYHSRPEQWLCFTIRDPEKVEYVSEKKMIIRHRSEFTGQHTVRVNCHVGHDFIKLLVNFQPGALYQLTGIPLKTLNNMSIDAESVFSKEITLVNSRLNSTDNYREMIDIVETFLIEKFTRLKIHVQSIDQIAKYLIRYPENISLTKLATEVNLSPRQFERKFIERTGIGIKLFGRIARFDKVCKLKYINPCDDWMSIAIACGYHDYPHLVRDCKEFAGTTPYDYFLQDTKAPERFFEFMKSEKYMVV